MKCKLCSLITDTFNLTLQCKTDRKCLKCIFVYEIFPHCIFWKVTFYNICIVSKNLGGGDHILFNIIVGASLNMLWYNWKLYYFRLHVYLSFFNSSSINKHHFDDFFVGADIYWNVFHEGGKRSPFLKHLSCLKIYVEIRKKPLDGITIEQTKRDHIVFIVPKITIYIFNCILY